MATELNDEVARGYTTAHFVHTSGQDNVAPKFWHGIKVSYEELEAEAQRLISIKKQSAVRRSFIVHPQSKTNTLTPGIRAAIEVTMPGEAVELTQKNSSSVGLSIAGTVSARIDGAELRIDKYDVWSVPNMAKVIYINEGSEPHVRLTFSDSPLFEFLHALYLSDGEMAPATPGDRQRDPMADFIHRLPTGGSAIKTYHAFIDPEAVEQSACLWKWEEVKDFLNKIEKDTPDLRAAIIGLLWNPATGRTNGSTNTLTACMNGGVVQIGQAQSGTWRGPIVTM
ncbi:hypothetical protein [Mesorhizobium wenxiniae]|uniref:hypothetical protein n=1 Tax=Mesorhizobium wenxiniae TaxID=2014805 RepID=UPI0010561650|nr:hypothetical protein [Mesorhizobium wenxiniae]